MQIISASRRTDIPAFFAGWFMERVKIGFWDVKNPYNAKQVKRVVLEDNDIIAFWTKNATNLLPYLPFLTKYNCCFFFTLNGYGKQLEPHVPTKEYLLSVFRTLGTAVGKEKVIWRYDPLIITEQTNAAWHIRNFSYLSEQLSGYAKRVIISYYDAYRHSQKRLQAKGIYHRQEAEFLPATLRAIAEKNGFTLQSCCNRMNGIEKSGCLSSDWLQELFPLPLPPKAKGQRKECLCIESVDIGSYNTCKHGCLYCYATKNVKNHFGG